MKRAFCLSAFALLALATLSQTGTQAVNKTFAERFNPSARIGDSGIYSFDKAHSFIEFTVNHNGLTEVPGFFRDFTGSINFDSKDITKSTVEFTAKATSIDTGIGARDNHLRTKDFFEVDKYPDITFKSTKVEKKGKGYLLTGDFTMKGVTKSITFPFQIVGWLPADDRSGGKMGIAAETSINRRDYGVTWGTNLPTGIAAVSDTVKILLQIDAGKKKDAAPKTGE
ncbi:MAG: YceI family protein [Acidobacteriota bacterium]